MTDNQRQTATFYWNARVKLCAGNVDAAPRMTEFHATSGRRDQAFERRILAIARQAS